MSYRRGHVYLLDVITARPRATRRLIVADIDADVDGDGDGLLGNKRQKGQAAFHQHRRGIFSAGHLLQKKGQSLCRAVKRPFPATKKGYYARFFPLGLIGHDGPFLQQPPCPYRSLFDAGLGAHVFFFFFCFFLLLSYF
ncbi:hypothetical protein TRIATDRAFT_298741 [Trichoderma atroviride IMI 206040]|uniref:Uncharacterized protein n=1 Tax=Hypocrea atroviridis (strain ATCC 20476 / IMI 206040) TaxID=452589 RepID=G9NNZ2_HYPAI|nr:uncharacterized protein TRIATDRAFT_298741 [Trichoderma atroviride IMI 206040]EHK47778.1 hypothetical protein TRIATDRAFT_298741 [Trichoderma atroviride IMI 206040]